MSATLPHLTLVLGGARSGKSRYAEGLAISVSEIPVYLATATAGDDEMAARIRHHQARRKSGWMTVEEPIDLVRAIAANSVAGRPLLIDCLTLWLANLMAAGRDLDDETAGLLEALANAEGPIILVSNEVGLGIVPDSKLGRDFRDHAGRLNQRVAAAADRVYLMIAGLPLTLKG